MIFPCVASKIFDVRNWATFWYSSTVQNQRKYGGRCSFYSAMKVIAGYLINKCKQIKNLGART